MTDIAELGFRADSRELRAANNELRTLSTTARAAETATERVNRGFERQSRMLGLLSTGVRQAQLAIGIVAGNAAFQALTKSIREFEVQMAAVRAVTGASEKDMKTLTAAARELGATTRYSAGEAAEGMTFLGQAGFSTQKIIAAMPAVLDLATAAQLQLGEAAEITSSIMAQFGLSADQAINVADDLAQAATSSNAGVRDMAEGMKYVGPISNALGISLKDTAAYIGILSNNAIKGSMAGTALRTIMSDLSKPTDMAKEAIKRLGIDVKRLNPQTNSLVEILKQFKGAGLETADAFRIVGQEGAPALMALINNIPQLQQLQNEMRDTTGTVKEMAAIMGNNLDGDVKELSSAWEELTLRMGDAGVRDGMRATVQAITEFVKLVSNSGTEIMTVAMVALAVAAGKVAAGLTGAGVKLANYTMLQNAHRAALVEDAVQTAASTAATAQNTAANLANAESHMAQTVAARASYNVMLQEAATKINASRATIEHAKANGTASISSGVLASAERTLTQALLARNVAMVNLKALSGQQVAAETALAAATRANAVAQGTAAAASGNAAKALAGAGIAARAAGVAMTGLRVVFLALGGWVGVAVAAIVGFVWWLTRAKEEANAAGTEGSKSLRELAAEAERMKAGGPLYTAEQTAALEKGRMEINELATAIGTLSAKRDAFIAQGNIPAAAQIQASITNAGNSIKVIADDMRRLQEAAAPAAAVIEEAFVAVDSQAEDAKKKIDALILSMEQELIMGSDLSKSDEVRIGLANGYYGVVTAGQAATMQALADEITKRDAVAATIDAQTAAVKKLNDEAAAVTKQFESPMEKYQKRVEELNRMRNAGKEGAAGGISAETYKRAILQAQADLEAVTEGVEKVGSTSVGVMSTMATFAEQAARNMQDIFAEFLFDPFHDGVKGMLKSFTEMLQRMVAQQAAAGLMGAFMGSPIGGALSSFFNPTSPSVGAVGGGPLIAAANGGHIQGPGGTRGDKIPAMLSDEEYVVNAKAVRNVGVGYLDRLNNGFKPRTKGFAEGGHVGGMRTGGANIDFQVINSGEPQKITKTEKSTGVDGRELYKVFVEPMLLRDAAVNGPVTQKMMGVMGQQRRPS